MTRRHRFLFVALFAASIAGIALEHHVVIRQRAELQSLRRQTTELARAVAKAESAREAGARELAEAERQLATLTPAAEAKAGRRAEMAAWLARMKRLKQLFAERPDQRIPELALLTDEDWLRIARLVQLDGDENTRKALAAVRSAAIERFVGKAQLAMARFAKTNPDAAIANTFVLAPFFDPPVDPAILERYALWRGTGASSPRGTVEWVLQNRAPIDADYDVRYQVTASEHGSGMNTSGGPWAWTPDFRERYVAASRAYMQANKGAAPAGISEVLPYFNPPLDPAVAARLIKAEREQR